MGSLVKAGQQSMDWVARLEEAGEALTRSMALIDEVVSLEEASEALTRSTAPIDVGASLEEAREVLTWSTAPVDVGASLEEASGALKRSMFLIDVEVARGIDDGMARSAERLKSLSRTRCLAPEAKRMHRSTVWALGAIGSSPQLSHSAG